MQLEAPRQTTSGNLGRPRRTIKNDLEMLEVTEKEIQELAADRIRNEDQCSTPYVAQILSESIS